MRLKSCVVVGGVLYITRWHRQMALDIISTMKWFGLEKSNLSWIRLFLTYRPTVIRTGPASGFYMSMILYTTLPPHLHFCKFLLHYSHTLYYYLLSFACYCPFPDYTVMHDAMCFCNYNRKHLIDKKISFHFISFHFISFLCG